MGTVVKYNHMGNGKCAGEGNSVYHRCHLSLALTVDAMGQPCPARGLWHLLVPVVRGVGVSPSMQHSRMSPGLGAGCEVRLYDMQAAGASQRGELVLSHLNICRASPHARVIYHPLNPT